MAFDLPDQRTAGRRNGRGHAPVRPRNTRLEIGRRHRRRRGRAHGRRSRRGVLVAHRVRRARCDRGDAHGRRNRPCRPGRLRSCGAAHPSPHAAARDLALAAVHRRQPRDLRRVRQPRHHLLPAERQPPAGPRLFADAGGARNTASHGRHARYCPPVPACLPNASVLASR